ncbi:glycoside hydrolase family 2 TIM barrel-domain containing protein [Flavobacterium cellulosilyticum]|uniref:Glycoside hydrolase family 2 protein n=1 Tax=Flavobacterium cellulosilyticum TaxID=2541731 RepID=A0A4R5C7J6_9FLAO|nr:glycoside hydrolase family 2 TIM barrel-domain containing protein [Flavobacterium cellulosilyticum]TDD95718.1 glycoside hydrolase family 2 protein [Flavobacterium cellulosilyticum]
MNYFKTKHLPFSLLLLFLALTTNAFSQARNTTNFDSDWQFSKGDVLGAEKPQFNAKQWTKLNVPHDWSIEGPYDRDNTSGRGGGYLPTGIGWYRKTFEINKEDAKKRTSIEFDGIMANSDVWINGTHLGKRPYGYISFSYDLTPYLNFDKPNVIAVRADNSTQPASRWYTGAGIYRHVRLVSVNPTHFTHWGTFITTPVATATRGVVNLKVEIENKGIAGDYNVQIDIIDKAGKIVKTVESQKNIAANATGLITQDIEIANPKLWNIDQPNLYTATTKLYSGKTLIDNQTISFGIKKSEFIAETGYWLNGKNIKLFGVCLHHDGGAVGAAVPLGVWKERFKKLKEVGVNAIRTSHNPVSPEFLDLCDQMGFVVMNETFDTWTAAKHNGEKGYNLYFKEWWEQDTKDMILRDRNHPSIVIYSIGNEIHDDLSYPEGYKTYKMQEDVVKKYDNTRPVTMALFRPANSKVYLSGFADHMDVVGQNYRENELIAAHEAHPNWKVIGTENTHVISQWLALRDKPYMAGQFLWTGYDYLGEADWPETTNNQGLFDRAGNWKQQGLQRDSWWSTEAVVHIVRKSDNAGAGSWVADWTPTDFDTYDNAKVQVYSNCDEVELFLNEKSLGSMKKPENDSPREWNVTFAEGTIKAIGKNNGKVVAQEAFTSAGEPAKIIITKSNPTLSNNWDDVSFITATVVDEKGIPCVNADNLIKFTISDSGKIIGVDNGNVMSHESYQSPERHAYNGKAIAIIKASQNGGKIEIKATAEGLESGAITVDIVAEKN